ncbi:MULTISPECIES: NifB/NifX family molybdenum-iron cluster-binding protein [Methanobacterium]|uniref:NifB/NifX family molybdenum-iron cluster-binding protein n=1 Tax=Methanobacterium TaxID=2160 RepID=UPI00159F2992|nr:MULTISPECIES: NifB/NifX family molybdenum-iron cluster-binding protein [Methanobacterium]
MVKITIIGIPTLDKRGLLADISMHFGKTPYFTLIKYEDNEIKDIEVIEIFGKHSGGSKTPAEIIMNSKADILICGNLGSKAVSMLSDGEMEIFSGASGKVKDVLKEWKVGNLTVADENSCNENDC